MNTSYEHIFGELKKLCDFSVTKLYSKNGSLRHIDVLIHIYVARLLLLKSVLKVKKFKTRKYTGVCLEGDKWRAYFTQQRQTMDLGLYALEFECLCC